VVRARRGLELIGRADPEKDRPYLRFGKRVAERNRETCPGERAAS